MGVGDGAGAMSCGWVGLRLGLGLAVTLGSTRIWLANPRGYGALREVYELGEDRKKNSLMMALEELAGGRLHTLLQGGGG